MKKITTKIPGWVIVIAIAITASILAVGLTITFVRASGRFNLPLSWILSPSGVSVDLDNNGIVDNVDSLPSGLIAMFDTDCPSGWTRVSALDGKFLVGGSSYNAAAGGSNTHTHGFTPAGTVSAPTFTGTAGTTGSAGSHYHQIAHKSADDFYLYMYNSDGSNRFFLHADADTYSGTDNEPWTSYGASGTFYSKSAGAHTHTFTPAGTVSAPTFTGTAGTTASADNRPEYATIVICKKD